jgi:thiol-disulfide isomerase/thioredoxin
VNKKNLRDHVTRFYKSRSFPNQKAQWLVGLARQSKLEEESPMYPSVKTWQPATLVGLTAGVTLLLVATVLYLRPGEPAPNNAVQHTAMAKHTGGEVDLESTDLFTPRLVAVKIHADWCARTPEVAPIFDDMTAEYGNQPILFVTLDITDETGRQQARYMAANLGISSVYDDPFESGMVKLIDRQDEQVLAVLTSEEHRPKMEGALALAFPPRH